MASAFETPQTSPDEKICFVNDCQVRRDECPGYCALLNSARILTTTLGSLTQSDDFTIVNGIAGIGQIEAALDEGCSQPNSVSHQLEIATRIIQGLAKNS